MSSTSIKNADTGLIDSPGDTFYKIYNDWFSLDIYLRM